MDIRTAEQSEHGGSLSGLETYVMSNSFGSIFSMGVTENSLETWQRTANFNHCETDRSGGRW